MNTNIFYDFLNEYMQFWEGILKDEKEKLTRISEGKLELIEKSVVEQQATIMKIEQMENKRIKLQENCGLGNKTFSQIQEVAPDDMKNQLKKIFGRFNTIIYELKYYNDKCKSIAKSHLDIMGSSYKNDSTPYGYRKPNIQANSILEKKI